MRLLIVLASTRYSSTPCYITEASPGDEILQIAGISGISSFPSFRCTMMSCTSRTITRRDNTHFWRFSFGPSSFAKHNFQLPYESFSIDRPRRLSNFMCSKEKKLIFVNSIKNLVCRLERTKYQSTQKSAKTKPVHDMRSPSARNGDGESNSHTRREDNRLKRRISALKIERQQCASSQHEEENLHPDLANHTHHRENHEHLTQELHTLSKQYRRLKAALGNPQQIKSEQSCDVQEFVSLSTSSKSTASITDLLFEKSSRVESPGNENSNIQKKPCKSEQSKSRRTAVKQRLRDLQDRRQALGEKIGILHGQLSMAQRQESQCTTAEAGNSSTLNVCYEKESQGDLGTTRVGSDEHESPLPPPPRSSLEIEHTLAARRHRREVRRASRELDRLSTINASDCELAVSKRRDTLEEAIERLEATWARAKSVVQRSKTRLPFDPSKGKSIRLTEQTMNARPGENSALKSSTKTPKRTVKRYVRGVIARKVLGEVQMNRHKITGGWREKTTNTITSSSSKRTNPATKQPHVAPTNVNHQKAQNATRLL